jgi:hypothetical protein
MAAECVAPRGDQGFVRWNHSIIFPCYNTSGARHQRLCLSATDVRCGCVKCLPRPILLYRIPYGCIISRVIFLVLFLFENRGIDCVGICLPMLGNFFWIVAVVDLSTGSQAAQVMAQPVLSERMNLSDNDSDHISGDPVGEPMEVVPRRAARRRLVLGDDVGVEVRALEWQLMVVSLNFSIIALH